MFCNTAEHNKADSLVDINSFNEKGYETKCVTKDYSGKIHTDQTLIHVMENIVVARAMTQDKPHGTTNITEQSMSAEVLQKVQGKLHTRFCKSK